MEGAEAQDSGTVAGDRSSESTGLRRSTRPGTAVPATVLIADMGSGALYLEGWRVGPSAHLTAEDATGLRRELATAFGADDAPHPEPGPAL